MLREEAFFSFGKIPLSSQTFKYAKNASGFPAIRLRKTKKKKEQYFVICLLSVRCSVATWVLPEP